MNLIKGSYRAHVRSHHAPRFEKRGMTLLVHAQEKNMETRRTTYNKTNPTNEECAKQDSCLLCIYKSCVRDLKDMGYSL